MHSTSGDVFAVNTYSYSQDKEICETLSRLSDRGYRAFELMVYPGHLWPTELDLPRRRALRALLEQRGLRLVSINMPNVDVNIAGAAPETRDYSLSLLTSCLDLAGDLGAEGMIVGPGKPNPLFPAPRERLVDYLHAALETLIPQSQRVGTGLWVENMPFAFLPDIEGLMAAVEEYGGNEVGVCYDVANAWFIGEDLQRGLNRAKSRLRLVHVSDTNQEVYRHAPVGAGTVPFAQIPAILAEVGYSDMPVLEIISAEPDRDIDESARRLIEGGW